MASVSETSCDAVASLDAYDKARAAINDAVAYLDTYDKARAAINDAAHAALNTAYARAVFRGATTSEDICNSANAIRDAAIALKALDVTYNRNDAAMKL